MTNSKKLISIFWILFFLLLITYSYSEIKKSSPGIKKKVDAERKVRLSWEEVDGAISYKFILKDSRGKVVFSKEVDNNSIVLEAKPGNYSIRIGAVNKFRKIGSWSNWAKISIEKPRVKQKEIVKKKPVKTEMFNMGLKLAAGMSYFYILPSWDEYYKDSYKGGSLNIAYSFRHHSSPGFLTILNYIGFDIEIDYIKFDGEKAFNRVESDLTNIFLSLHFF